MYFRQKVVCLILLAMIAGSVVIILLGPQEQQIAHGVVRDETGPVMGAIIRLRGSDRYVLTDAQGGFRLTGAAGDTGAQLTAWAPGYFVVGSDLADFTDSDGASLLLHRHPTADNPDYTFISPLLDNPMACAHCHRERTGETGGAMPLDEWLLDAHSGAAANPRFRSLYNGTTVDGVSGVATTFRFDPAQGVSVPVAPSMGADRVGPGFRLDFPEQSGSCAACHVPVLALQSPYHADPNQSAGAAAEGVTCDFCHKIQNVRLYPDGRPNPGLPGVLSIDFLRPPEGEQVFIGPFDDTPGDDIYSPLQNESQFCAACHSGQFWDVGIYDSFGEWLNSPYSDPDSGRTCQDCHMPRAGVTRFAQLPPDNPLVLPPRNPDTIFSHRMPGAADQQLLANTASLEAETQRTDERLQVTVRVTNTGAGHHIPTDNPLRNLILLVQVAGGDGQPLPLIDGPTIPSWGGEGDPAEGYYAGQPGVLYAKLLADFYTGEVPSYAYWRQTRLVSDNRIPALAADETVYTFAAPAGSLTVDVRLYLRRAFIALMDLKHWDLPDILMEQQIVRLP
jgi:hypothetical protein